MDGSASFAKISRPSTIDYHVSPRIFQRIDELRRYPVIWVSAPAGFGKTSLLANYIEQRGLGCLWYQLDAGDEDIALFFHYLGLAADKFRSGRRLSLPLFSPEHFPSLQAFTKKYFRQLGECCSPPTFLVLDNYQDLPAGSLLHSLLPYAFSEMPSGMTVVINSRVAPPPTYARMQASSSMVVVGREELRLTEEESRKVCQTRASDMTLSDEVLRIIHVKSQGWVAGLVLLLEQVKHLNLSKVEQIEDSLGLGENIVFDYFSGEMFERAGNEVKHILLTSAFLPRFTVEMLQRVSGDDKAPAILSELVRGNFFIYQHFGRVPSYEYHPLFRDFLASLARKTFSATQLKGLQKQCAELLENDGQVEEAAWLLREGQDWPTLAGLVLKNAQAFCKHGRNRTILAWIEGLPKSLFDDEPWLVYWQGVSLFPFSPAEGRKYLEQAFCLFKECGNIEGQLLSWSGIVETIICEWGDFKPLDRWIAEIEILLPHVSNLLPEEINARVCYAIFIALMNRQPQHPELPKWEERVWNLALAHPDKVSRIMIGSHLLIYTTWWRGDLGKARILVDSMRSIVSSDDIPPLARITWNTMWAGYLWMIADNSQSKQVIDQTLALASETGIHLWDTLLYCQGVIATLSSGNFSDADNYLEIMGSTLEGARPLDRSMYYYVLAWNLHEEGDLGAAHQGLETALAMTEDAGCVFFRGVVRSELGRILFEMGETARGLAVMEQALEEGGYMNCPTVVYLSGLASAECALINGNEQACLTGLHRSMDIARRFGIFNHPWWRPGVMSRLAAKALEHEIEVDWIPSLIRKRGLRPEPGAGHLENWPWPVKIYTLGRFSLLRDDLPLPVSGKSQKRPLELLKLLIAMGGRDVCANHLADVLWPDVTGDAGVDSLKTTLARLRKLLGSQSAIQYSNAKVSLDSTYCWVDCWAFERLLQVADEDLGKPKKALSLYNGPFLNSDTDYQWALPVRERLRAKFRQVTVAFGTCMEKQEDFTQAIQFYEQSLSRDDLAEVFYRRLMRCYQQSGRIAEAIATYRRCLNVLSAKSGIQPSAQTREIYQRLIHG